MYWIVYLKSQFVVLARQLWTLVLWVAYHFLPIYWLVDVRLNGWVLGINVKWWPNHFHLFGYGSDFIRVHILWCHNHEILDHGLVWFSASSEVIHMVSIRLVALDANVGWPVVSRTIRALSLNLSSPMYDKGATLTYPAAVLDFDVWHIMILDLPSPWLVRLKIGVSNHYLEWTDVPFGLIADRHLDTHHVWYL